MKKILKRLSLVLVLSLCLTILPIPAYADSSDLRTASWWPAGNSLLDDEDPVESNMASEVLKSVGIYGPNTGNYMNPKSNITREEAAGILYRVISGDVDSSEAEKYAGDAPFTDLTSSWSKGYIGYCAKGDYIKGYDGKFSPKDKVTGYETLAMILRAVGYDKNEEFTGDDWEKNVAATAQQLGLLQNIGSETDLSKPVTRDVAAELLFQSILTPTVEYTPDGSYQPKTGEDSGDVTLGDNLGLDDALAKYRDQQNAQELENQNNQEAKVTHQFLDKETLVYKVSMGSGAANAEKVDNLIAQIYPLYGERGQIITPTQIKVGQDVVDFANQNNSQLILNAKKFALGITAGEGTAQITDGLNIQITPDTETKSSLTFAAEGAAVPVQASALFRMEEPVLTAGGLTDVGTGNDLFLTGTTADRRGLVGSFTLSNTPVTIGATITDQTPEVVPVEDIIASNTKLKEAVDGYNAPTATTELRDILDIMDSGLYFPIGLHGKHTLTQLLEIVYTYDLEKLEKAIAEAKLRYPGLFPQDFTNDTVLTGEQIVAIFAVLNGWYMDFSLLNPEVTANDACLAVPKHLVKIRKPMEWVIYPDDGETGTSASPWALGYYTLDENGFLVPVDSTEGAWDFLFEFRNDGWYDVNHGENIKLENAPLPEG